MRGLQVRWLGNGVPAALVRTVTSIRRVDSDGIQASCRQSTSFINIPVENGSVSDRGPSLAEFW